jgi:hypothetical protein
VHWRLLTTREVGSVELGYQIATVMSVGSPSRQVNRIVGAADGDLKTLDIRGEASSLRVVESDGCANFVGRGNDHIPALISWLLQRATGTVC